MTPESQAESLPRGELPNLISGLWPVVLQRYNRVRLYRAINLRSHLQVAECCEATYGVH
jgi:hypothetical protein